MENFKKIIKPVVVISIAVVVTAIIISMIAYTNSEESKIFIDAFFKEEVITTTLLQA